MGKFLHVDWLFPSMCQQECPCVESVQDSTLIPVNVERKVTLVGKHLNVFQVPTATRLRLGRFGSVQLTWFVAIERAGRHAGLRVRAGRRGPVGGGGGVCGAGRNGLVLPHYLRAAPGQKASLRMRRGPTSWFTLTESDRNAEVNTNVCGFSVYGRSRKN